MTDVEAEAGPTGAEPELSLDLPAPWEPVPVDPEPYDEWMSAKLDQTDLAEDARHRLEVAFRSTLIEARSLGLVMAAGFVGALSPEPGGTFEPLAACLFAAVQPAGELAGKLSSVAWLAALADAERDGTIHLMKPTDVVMLGEREAVRAVTLEELPADQFGPAMPIFGVTYYLAVADGDAMLAVGFRTPCVSLTPEFEDLFADIAGTLEVRI